jgi:hypothetical protein
MPILRRASGAWCAIALRGTSDDAMAHLRATWAVSDVTDTGV